jgi:tumor protein p53-inducible protein 3
MIYFNLIGKVQSGDWVLIHAGGSGVGTAATQLSVLAGAHPIVTAGSQAKIDKAKSLGAMAGFSYKEGDFSKGVKEYTKSKDTNIITFRCDLSCTKKCVICMYYFQL